MASPYANEPEQRWSEITERLINEHPLSNEDIVSAVLEAWEGIMKTSIAGELQIGVDIFPTPQILGNYLHELIPVILERRYPDLWARDVQKNDKDLVCVQNSFYSCEIKTSSNSNNIFGNASYGQEDSSNSTSKSKDGYYIAVNFEVSLPEDWAKKDAVYRVCEGLNAIEVQFDDGDEVIRKAKDDGDISGDYNEYASEETMTIGEAQVTFKGTSEDEVNLAVWVSGDYSYSVSSTDAVSADQMKKIVEAVK